MIKKLIVFRKMMDIERVEWFEIEVTAALESEDSSIKNSIHFTLSIFRVEAL